MTEAEFETIYLAHFSAVRRYALQLCRRAQTADEITSDTFFRALRAIDRFDGKCDLRTWLFGIAKNSYFSYLREARRLVPLDSVPEPGDTGEDPGDRLADAEMSDAILKALHTLPEPYREVFTLRVFAEQSFRQIAEKTGKTENWACVTYHRAKDKIQMLLEETT